MGTERPKSLKTILVAGCGGHLGISIGRILRMELPAAQLIGTDIKSGHPGPAFFDHCEILPPVRETDAYIDALRAVLHKYDVDAIVPISDAELVFFGEPEGRRAFDDRVLVLANEKALTIGRDKFLTADFLKSQSLPHPWTYRVGKAEPPAFPCVLKPRVGSGGKGLQIVREEAFTKLDLAAYGDFVWQEYLEPADQEYTCGLFRSRRGDIRTLILKRSLAGDVTGSGEVISNPEICRLLEAIAAGLALVGSINVQLRLTAKGPMVFEINPRFSSTIVFRHLFGFKDVIWSIQDQLRSDIGGYQPTRDGMRFFRIAHEVILPPEQFLRSIGSG